MLLVYDSIARKIHSGLVIRVIRGGPNAPNNSGRLTWPVWRFDSLGWFVCGKSVGNVYTLRQSREELLTALRGLSIYTD